jgi:hypothetical protein
LQVKKNGRSLDEVIKESFHFPANLPEGLTPEKLQAWLQDNPGATPADGVRKYGQFQQEKRDEARHKVEDTPNKENAPTESRLKIGDRVSAINDGRIALYSGVFDHPKKPRLYGTVMDVEFDPKHQRSADWRSDRYAVKWDAGNLVWIDGRQDLQRMGGTKEAARP